MKSILYPLILFITVFVSCGLDEDQNLEAYNSEAFVFDIGEEYEVNASVRIRGFRLEEHGEEFSSSVFYELDLQRPDGTIEEEFVSKIEEFIFSEKVKDAGIDFQFNLDKSYVPGRYNLIINLTDNYTENSTMAIAEFTLNE
jgi:hypothetical protein